MKKILLVSALALAVGASAPKAYLKDWQAVDAPADASQIITLAAFPEAGRQFEVRRTYRTNRSDRRNRRTPRKGYVETLKVADEKGKLEFWRDGKLIHTIRLGPCFSFAMMDRDHDFAGQGSPAYFTVPPDCKVWDGRKWNQTYRTLVVGWYNQCVYEAERYAKVTGDSGARVVRSSSSIHMTMEKDGTTYDWRTVVEYDEKLSFFKMFDVGYVGKVEILREIGK